MRRAALALAFLTAIPALAGPPFQTDDPDPVDFHHFEMYVFELSDSTGKNAGGTSLEVPAYEVNYGAAPSLQLHLVLPLSASFAPSGGSTNYGIGDTEFGFKYRLFKETPHSPEIGIFPFFEFPTGNADRGLGVGNTWYRIPVWLQKSWGPKDTQWTSYGGGGEAVVPQDGYTNYPFAGWLVERQINKRIALGAELFGHGAEGPAALSTRASTMLDLGGIYEFHDGFDILFAAGRSIYGQPETYSYLSFYWTWGPKEVDDPAPAKPDGSKPSKMLNAMSRIHI
jgi:hypothetical protein